MEGDETKAQWKHCNRKAEKFVNIYSADIRSFTALRLETKALHVWIHGEVARIENCQN